MTTPGTRRRPATRAEARALAHPLRLRILRLCLDEALTNRELAERLGEQPATVLYHVRTLVRTDFLRREEERRGRRGSREIPYRSTKKSWSLSFEADTTGHLAMVDATRSELIEAGPEAVLDLVRMAVRLDPAVLARLERRIKRLVADADAADGSGDESIGILIAVHRRR
ncbi:MAG: helix-turn-helix domain-containing protein [Chloroflexi bacterium]|nr:helix-turn-helix domain-containing protein [Chloroflexota bacterium]